jgi:L-2-hydroxycarboxylate dehydrogenase (NAD+)
LVGGSFGHQNRNTQQITMSEAASPPTAPGTLYYVMPVEQHESLVNKAYLRRGFSDEEATHAAQVATNASYHGIRTHNALKALHLDDHMGSMGGKGNGCVPKAEIIKKDSPYKAVERWDCQRKLGQSVAQAAMQRCMELADEYGVGVVAVDNAFHYLWGEFASFFAAPQ